MNVWSAPFVSPGVFTALIRKWYVVAGESAVSVALTVVRPLAAGTLMTSVESL